MRQLLQNATFISIATVQGMFTYYLITGNEILFLSKWPQWNNTRSKFHFWVIHVNCYKRLTKHQTEKISSK